MNKEMDHPAGAQLQYPDGTVYLYLQSAQKLPKGTFVQDGSLGRVTKFKGGDRLPQGVTMEDVERDGWSFVKVQNGQPTVAPTPTIVSPGDSTEH